MGISKEKSVLPGHLFSPNTDIEFIFTSWCWRFWWTACVHHILWKIILLENTLRHRESFGVTLCRARSWSGSSKWVPSSPGNSVILALISLQHLGLFNCGFPSYKLLFLNNYCSFTLFLLQFSQTKNHQCKHSVGSELPPPVTRCTHKIPQFLNRSIDQYLHQSTGFQLSSAVPNLCSAVNTSALF